MNAEHEDRALELAGSAIAARSRKRYRSANRSYRAFAAEVGRDAGDPQTLLVYLHSRRSLANSTLRIDVLGIRWASTGAPDPTRSPEVHRYLSAHGRANGTRPNPARTAACLTSAATGQLLSAHWPASTVDKERVAQRGMVAMLLRAAAGPSVDLPTVARVATDAVHFEADTAIIDVNGYPVELHARTEGDPCPMTLLRNVSRWATEAGTRHLFGWASSDGTLRVVTRPTGLVTSQMNGAYGRAGIDPAVHPSTLSDAALRRLVAHVDPSYRLGLRTKAFAATAFVTAARHSDLAAVQLPLAADDGRYELFVGCSKADQEGRGHSVFVDHLPAHGPRCPGCLLKLWLDELPDSGPLFPALATGGAPLATIVAVEEMNVALRRLVAATSIDTGERNLSTHSFRRSHSTIRAERGESAEEIAADTHQSPEVVWAHYVEPARLRDIQAQIRFE